VPFVRRRPLLRAAAVGAGAYQVGKRRQEARRRDERRRLERLDGRGEPGDDKFLGKSPNHPKES
jgi:hypothetical protein